MWQRIAETERALRAVVREVYVARFGDSAAREESRRRCLRVNARRSRGTWRGVPRERSRSASSTTSTSVSYHAILFAPDVQQEARSRFGGAQDPKQRLLAAVSQIAPVRNEIAHVREIDRDRLLRASVACADVLEMLKRNG